MATVKTVGPKIPTAASAAQHKAGGGNVKITDAPVKFNTGPKVSHMTHSHMTRICIRHFN
jgi:hypothetical protein